MNGGSGTMSAGKVEAGNYTMPECGFAAPSNDKVFWGWGETADAKTEDLINPGDTYVVNKNVTFYAIWGDKAPAKYTAVACLEKTYGKRDYFESNSSSYNDNGEGFIGDVVEVKDKNITGYVLAGAEKKRIFANNTRINAYYNIKSLDGINGSDASVVGAGKDAAHVAYDSVNETVILSGTRVIEIIRHLVTI